MTSSRRPQALLAVEAAAGMQWIQDAVARAGGEIVAPANADAIVWGADAPPGALAELLESYSNLGWIQLPWAGVEPFLPVIRAHPHRCWTCGKGAYAQPVAELALALAIGSLRRIPQYTRASQWMRHEAVGHLNGAQVTIIGGGGIALALMRLLQPFDVEVKVVRRSPVPMPGVAEVMGPDDLHRACCGARVVFLALPSTPETRGLVDRQAMDLIGPRGVLVNVGRGNHVITDDLTAALADGSLGGAALDVTDPEPLPPGHPLWSIPTCVITPHIANDDVTTRPLLIKRIIDNVERFAAGRSLLGQVDPAAGY